MAAPRASPHCRLRAGAYVWSDFLIAYLFGVLALLLPGLLLVRALRFDRLGALALSALVSTCLYAVIGTVLPFVGAVASWRLVLVLALVPGGVARAVQALRGETAPELTADAALGSRVASRGPLARLSWGQLAVIAALVAGVVCVFAVFVLSIGSAGAFVQNYDNAFHLNRVRSFADGGCWSSLAGGFYPSSWHCLCALVASATGVGVTVAVNATNALIVSVAYPLSMLYLLGTLFGDRPSRVVLGCAACTSIAFFPWRIMLFGPLYPNVLSLSLMPAVAGVFIGLVGRGLPLGRRVRFAALFAIGGVALALAQPNAVFSAGVFLVPFCLYRAWSAALSAREGRPLRVPFAAATALALLCLFAAAWLALMRVPLFSDIVNYPRDAPLEVVEAVKMMSSFSFVLRRPQFAATLVALLGALALLRDARLRWVPFSCALMMAQYVVAISCEGPLRTLVTGFWYNDYHRLAAAACVATVPLLAAGLDLVVRLGSRGAELLGERLSRGRSEVPDLRPLIVALLLSGLFVLNTFPLRFLPHSLQAFGFDAVAFELRDMFVTGEGRALDEEELSFLGEVADVVSIEDVVINQAHDGSVFAYATEGVNVLFKQYSVPSTPEIETLRTRLCAYATDAAVRDAVDAVGGTYVLQLDHGSAPTGMSEDATYYPYWYDAASWAGINSVDDDTPGFELVLSSGDMRLYRIDR